MTDIEARLRSALADMAEEAQPAPLLARLDARAPQVRRRRGLALVAVAAALALAAASGVLVQERLRSMPQPSDDPPPVFSIGVEESSRPGAAWLAVTLAGVESSAFVAPAGGGAAVTVPAGDDRYVSQRLSPDGSRLTRAGAAGGFGRHVWVLDLVTGEVADAGVVDTEAVVAELSPDNGTVALYRDWSEGDVELVDVASGRATGRVSVEPIAPQNILARGQTPGLGWAPDGTRLAVHDGDDLLVVDREGVELELLPGVHLTNGSQSWSPDSRAILVFDDDAGAFAVQPAEGGDAVILTPPPGALRPLGWAGDRVVWLLGDPGAQQLVAADPDGGEARTWIRFEVGDAIVDNVTWSRALSG